MYGNKESGLREGLLRGGADPAQPEASGVMALGSINQSPNGSAGEPPQTGSAAAISSLSGFRASTTVAPNLPQIRDPTKQSLGSSSPTRKPYIPRKGDPLTSKLKYYGELRKMAAATSDDSRAQLLPIDQGSPAEKDGVFLSPPAHVLPSYLFVIGSKIGAPGAKQKRWQTIASIVNTMMGTTIVALPYGVATTGIGLSLVIIALMGVISCSTCLLIVWYGKGGAEFSSIVASYLGRPPQYIAWFMSTGIIAGAAIVYHILMQESLYQLVGAVLTGANASDEWWKRPYAALIPLVVYPICNFKDMSALVKVNSIGFVFLWYTLLFIVYHGVNVIVKGEGFVITTTEATEPFDPVTGDLFLNVGASGNFGALGGMMMLSFFIHNCIQPILKNAQTDTQYTDIIIAYSIAGCLYAVVGVVGYFGFADAQAASTCVGPSASCALSSNFLSLFGSTFETGTDIYAFSARVSLLFQLLTVYPLLLLIIRTQVFGLIMKTTWPGLWQVALLNAAVMGLTFTFAALDLQISIVLRFTGAIAGLVLIFAIPIAIDVKERLRDGNLGVVRGILHASIIALGVAVFIMQFL